jgi:hypothetical protein
MSYLLNIKSNIHFAHKMYLFHMILRIKSVSLNRINQLVFILETQCYL